MMGGGGANAFRLCVSAFSALVLSVAAYANRYAPGLAVSGEESAGSWLSGVLLVAAMTLSLLEAVRVGNRAWYPIALFFSLLALDERFMFHERLARRLAFAFPQAPPSWKWLHQAPVLAGALAGAAVTRFLWKRLGRGARGLLLAAAGMGTASVLMDMLAAGAYIEDGLKLMAELALVCALAEVPFKENTR